MKTVVSFIITLVFAYNLCGQNTPVLRDDELLKKEDLKKKVGWMKMKFDGNFNKTTDEKQVKYECYAFYNIKEGLSQMYFNGFSTHNVKVIYTKTDSLSNSKVLNGTLTFYDKKNIVGCKYFFKDGFLIRFCNYQWRAPEGNKLENKYKKRVLMEACEYIPSKNSVEFNLNCYDNEGKLLDFGHFIEDGYKNLAKKSTWKELPYKKIDVNEKFFFIPVQK